MYYMGKNYAIDLAGWEFGYSSILNGCAELSGYLILSLVVNQMPRKNGILVPSGFLILFGLLFFFKQIVDNHLLQMILFGIIIIIGTFVFTSILLFATEIFPSKVSATAFGLVNIAGQLGIFFAPYLVTYGINNQIYPLALISCL